MILKTLNFLMCFFVWLLIFTSGNVYATGSSVTNDSVLQVNKSADFEVTGDGSASNWKNVEWLSLDQIKKDGAVYQTRFKILYSEKGFYFLFDCEDKKITATMKEDFLDIFTEDVVEVFLWPDEKMPVYLEYELSPLNYELPILVPHMGDDFMGWRPWHYEGERKTRHATRVSHDKNGDSISSWTAECFIPFALMNPLLNVPPRAGTRWRANFYRIDYDKGSSYWAWRKINRSFHEFEKYGTLLFK